MQKSNYYRTAAATCFAISATTFHRTYFLERESNKGDVGIPIGRHEPHYVGNAPGSLLADETVLSRNARSRKNGMMRIYANSAPSVTSQLISLRYITGSADSRRM